MAERESSLLSSICEPNLRTAFSDFFDALDDEDCQIMAPNNIVAGKDSDEEDIDNLLEMEIIDF